MATRYGWPLAFTLVAVAVISTPAIPRAARQAGRETGRRPDFDIRNGLPPAAPRQVLPATGSQGRGPARERLNRDSGSVRVLDPALIADPRAGAPALSRWLAGEAARLGLDRADLASLVLVRDYVTRATGVRHVLLRQVVDGYPVFDSAIALHIAASGKVLRVTSNAAPTAGRNAHTSFTAESASREAALHADGTPETAALSWLPVAGTLRLAWHVVVRGDADVADVLIDAQTGELLVRRSRGRDAVTGRVMQSAAQLALAPRQPDEMPAGASGCPPPTNYELRALDAPFRDPATVVAATGRLEGNNVRVFRGNGGASATGTPTADGWVFDFPFNSAASAETTLFFGVNFVHDFFYDLGFDEAAGNFQVDNFGRGGAGGDPLNINARAPGRNNANYVHAPDGSSPTINMFVWDGLGCWGADIDGDGTADIDGDYDLDILVHEFHHGVSLRLNTAFTGDEAGAIGEGGGDFFAYSVNNNSRLAEYSRPGGLRTVNGKGYGDWTCLLGLFCEPHDNGEIWANVLWDLRERFRADMVLGSLPAATNEVHQLYVDALALSPPDPTMLDMRDSILLADVVRNPSGPSSANFCRIWESFAGRGMGASARDTAESGGFNQVTPAYDVPSGCVAPPGPPVVTLTASAPTATEAGTVPGSFTVRRDAVSNRSLTVSVFIGGSAASGVDYAPLATATIPAGAAEGVISVVPIDDALVENNETVTLTLQTGSGYTVGTPSFATVTIVSDDVAPDMTVTALTVPTKAAPGAMITVTDTTRNQGSGAAAASQTNFYLSRDALLDAADPLIGSRPVDPLAAGTSSSGTTSVVLPDPLVAGTYFLFAKADGPAQLMEISETNNTRASTISIGPDLLVSAFTAPGAAAPGSTFNVTETTTNQGAGAAPASSTAFYLSVNATFDASDTRLQARPVPALASGAVSSATTSITLPAVVPTATYYLLAQADGDAAIGELNELNNTRAIAIKIGPDLTVSALTVPTRAAAGASIAVTDTTVNSGLAPAGASTTAFYLSQNLSLDPADFRLSPARPVPALGAGESNAGTTTVTLPQVAPGLWYVLANADDGAGVVETQETNNVKFASVTIGPDLTVLTALSPYAATAGSTISVTTTIKNAGGGAAGASTTRFYLSANMIFDALDTPLAATQAVPALAADGTFGATTSIALPSDKVGNFYLLIVADGNQSVIEASENNNVAARLLQLASQ